MRMVPCFKFWSVLGLVVSQAAASVGRVKNALRGFKIVDPVENADQTIEGDFLAPKKRFFARYSGWQGRRLVQNCAHVIVDDEDHTDYTVFESDADCFEKLRQDSTILSVEEDHRVYAFGRSIETVSDLEVLRRQLSEEVPWGIEAIQADQVPVGEYTVTVCVIDTGVALGHPDLNSNRITGVNREDKTWRWDKDRAGHGTHVSGIIAAAAGNGYGVQGVGMFDLLIVRALGDDSTGFESDIYKAVNICVKKGANVVNLSLGSPLMSDFARESYTAAVEEHGVLLVAAAGNDGDHTKNFPASHPSVISVGAVYDYGKRYFSSVQNNQIELMAPGHDIISTSVATHAVKTDSFAYPAQRVVGTPDRPATGMLAYCDFNSEECSDVQEGGICLFNGDNDATQSTSHVEALASCEASGGSGAIFYNGNSGDHNVDTMYVPGGTIPAICISKSSALALFDLLEDGGSFQVTMGDEGNDRVEYTFESMNGTSMAAPHVTASAALLLSHFPECTPQHLRYALAFTAEHPEDGCDEGYGYGMVKVKDAYDWLLAKNGCDGWDVPAISKGGCTTI